jgi:phosphomannomutase
MRDTGAVYGGEMSAHHYFRDFMCCDSGMIPWLLVVELIGRSGRSLAELLELRRAAFPSSGEINFRVQDVAAAVAAIEAVYAPQAQGRDDLDGLSLEFGTWRFNLRASNTEPLLRLNVESRGRRDVIDTAVAEISALIAAL